MGKIVEAKEYDYIARQRLIEEICKKYTFIKKFSIGKSCAGRELTALKIGAAKDYALVTAAFHGSERITSTVLLMFIENLAEALLENREIAGFKAKSALWGRGVIFVPCVNPDGCEIALYGKGACQNFGENIERICKRDFEHWNANLRGVDINHNFDADWENLRNRERKMGIYGPSPTRFGGYKPESEPETIAICELCRKINIRIATALHTQGEVIYWDFKDLQPPRSKRMAEIMATASGYALDIPIGIATGGGFKDWFIQEFHKPAFTVELGRGKNPLNAETAEQIYKTVEELMMLVSIM